MKLELQRLRQCADYNLAVCVLASGSKGNAIYISDGFTAILIDAGLSATEIKRRLKSRGLNPRDLNAILVTHEHSDHIQAVGVLSRQLKLPIYLSRSIEKKLSSGNSLHEIRTFNSGSTFQINNLAVHPFAVSHDAADPVGFTIGQNGSRIGVATDLGTVTPHVKENLRHCHLLILEANHDPDMLINGPYPWHLKRRIRRRVIATDYGISVRRDVEFRATGDLRSEGSIDRIAVYVEFGVWIGCSDPDLSREVSVAEAVERPFPAGRRAAIGVAVYAV